MKSLIKTIKLQGISDKRVLGAIESTPRDIFVPEDLHDRAYSDTALPVGHGQTISQPSLVALMTEQLGVDKNSKVLEIGTGSGYQAAVLSRICKDVYTVERIRPLIEYAQTRFSTLNISNIRVKFDDGNLGWPEEAPFDAIIVTASASETPSALVEQLSDSNGIMLIPVKNPHTGYEELLKLRKTKTGIEKEALLEVRFVPLLDGMEG